MAEAFEVYSPGVSEAKSSRRSETPISVSDLYEKYRAELYGFFRNKVSDPERAEDLLQQVFLKILAKSGGYADFDNPRAYLFAVARHVLIDHYRHDQIRRAGDEIEFLDSQHCDNLVSPLRKRVSDEYFRELVSALEPLSITVQRSFILNRVYGYTSKEVADLLDLSPRTVQKHIAKGLATCYLSMHSAKSE